MLSLITINFNNKAGLQKTIDSVLKQSNNDFEYIIIDGGSVDGSLDIIKENTSEDRILYKTYSSLPNGYKFHIAK